MEFKFSFNGANKTGECICNTTDHEAELWQENFSKFAEMFEWFNDNTSKSKETADAIATAIIAFCNSYATKEKTYAEDINRKITRNWRYEDRNEAEEEYRRHRNKTEDDEAKRTNLR